MPAQYATPTLQGETNIMNVSWLLCGLFLIPRRTGKPQHECHNDGTSACTEQDTVTRRAHAEAQRIARRAIATYRLDKPNLW